MKPEIVKFDFEREFFTPERCFIVSAGEDSATCSGDESRTKTFKYIWVESGLSRKAESAGEMFAKSYVRTDCAEFKPVELRRWASCEAGSPVACSGEEVTSEIRNSSNDEILSIARARVKPGVMTALHYLKGVTERYLITSGNGMVEAGDLPPTKVSIGDVITIPAGIPQRITNTGETDLIFYCICTPRFSPDCYHNLEKE